LLYPSLSFTSHHPKGSKVSIIDLLKMVRTKVFVGHLDFKTQESELAQEFAAAGTVISANIITRGPISLGYGFVELDSEKSAENAVNILNKKKVNGREINVEIAKDRPEGLPSRNNNNNEEGAPRRRFRPRFRKQFGGENENNDSENSPGNGPSGPPRRRFRRAQQHDQENGEGQASPQRQPRAPRPRRPIEERNNSTPSKTTLFVANLPFALDDVEFGQVFSEEGLAFKSAHVVKKRNLRSKGFGFVEFENEADQQKALQAINNKIVKERELIVKVALTEQKHREESSAPREESKQEKPVEPRKEEKKVEPKKEEKKTPEQPKKEEKVQEKKPAAEEKKPEPKKEEKKPEPKKDDTKPADKKPEVKKKPETKSDK